MGVGGEKGRSFVGVRGKGRSRMRRGEKERNPTTVGCGLRRPLMCRSRRQSFFGEEEKKRVVNSFE